MVKVIENNSTEDEYSFLIKAIKSNIDMPLAFTVSHNRKVYGYWNDMSQFYPEGQEEYILLPLGTEYQFTYE